MAVFEFRYKLDRGRCIVIRE